MNKLIKKQIKARPTPWFSLKSYRSLPLIAVLLISAQIVLAQAGLYEQGQNQLDNKNYKAAANTYNELLKSGKGKNDAAQYWLAYAEFKSGQNQKALSSIAKLMKEYPNSAWLDDAAALKVEIQDHSGQGVDVSSDELKLYALNSLMNSPSQKSFEILSKLLAGNSSTQVKQRALFVLSQIDNPKSFELIAQLAEESPNQRLQQEAIRVLGISGSQQAIEQLSKIYQSSDQEAQKLEILHSFMVADQSEQLLKAVKSESSFAIKKEAIHLIGVMSGTQDILLELYRDDNLNEHRGDILHSLAIGRDSTDVLLKILSEEQNPALRKATVESMGILSNASAGDALINIYNTETDYEIRKAALHALFIQSNAQALRKIVQTESDPELKREALHKLSMTNSDEALQFFDDILNDEG